jgi:hypothetical protein
VKIHDTEVKRKRSEAEKQKRLEASSAEQNQTEEKINNTI